MTFVAGSIKTKEAGAKGGKTGKKYLSTLPKAKLKKLTSKAGKRSGEVRRANRDQLNKKAIKYADKVMHSYLI